MKKIMFNDKYGLTKAVLERRKVQTRRIITTNSVDWKAFEEGNYDCIITDDAIAVTDIRDYAAYRVGDEVAIAQRYLEMFVDPKLMPHRIRITNIRVERLQDISDEDCLKEGIIEKPIGTTPTYWVLDVGFSNIRHAFRNLIDKTCGDGAWDSNPYVFVYDFELVK